MNDVDLEINDEDTGRPVEHPKSLIPPELEIQNPDKEAADNEEEKAKQQKFNEYYLNLMTTGFGEDLNAVRSSKDFTPASMPIIIRALKEGINMFDKEQRDLILSTGK